MRLLPFGIGVGNQRARLTQPETPLPKQALALAHSQIHLEAPLNPGAQSFSVPQRPRQSHVARRATQDCIDVLQLRRAQTLGASGSFAFDQSGQPFGLKAPNPVFYRTRSVSQKSADRGTVHPLGDQQHSVKPVIVARFFRAANLILQAQNDAFSISNLQWSHVSRKPQSAIMRNYL